MNILDMACIAILGLFMLGGIYKGFLPTLLNIASYILAVLLAFVIRPIGVSLVTGNQQLFNMMLYYTEGSEFIPNPEFVRTEIASLSAEEIGRIIDQGNLPYPMGREIAENIAKEAFLDQGIVNLGDYFNQTIVISVIGILAFLGAYAAVRLLFALVINGIDYARPFPVLRRFDPVLGGVLGIVRGCLALLLIFMLTPLVLTMLGQFEMITDMVAQSRFAGLFYRSNFLLSLAA